MMGGDDVIARICQNIVETKIRHRKSVLKGKRYIMSEIFTLGIDVGSTASKCIILKDGKEIVGKSLIDVGAGTSGPNRAIEAVLEDAGLKKEDMAFTLATGYGRTSLMDGIADKQMSELSCHAKGAYFLFPKVHTVIDIGGQDVKVLRVEDGVMTNFQMNDKCAAGTGRFLDVMARVLEVEVSDLGRLGAMSKKQVGISSTCTVFAESEVISQLSMGTDKCDIIAGIHRSVAHRVTGLAHRIGVVPDVVMTGGVAQNQGVVDALEAELGVKIYTSPLTQYNGALGAALMAYQVASRQK
jgi:activator of (R)-2-hydroxyglutaryl-coA dehydratase